MPRIGGQEVRRNKPRTRAQRRRKRLSMEKARLRRDERLVSGALRKKKSERGKENETERGRSRDARNTY